jgi:23S rRNA (uracil1939-C5)-methyltransferase
VFTQVSSAGNASLVATVVQLARITQGMRVLDLYCGAGNFALPLARRGATVAAVERSPLAARAARANARRLGIRGVTVAIDDVRALLEATATRSADLVVLDPPRHGARDALGALTAHRPGRILYVSCDPATLARDARILCDGGYRLGTVQPVDLFPQTYHVETVAAFELT